VGPRAVLWDVGNVIVRWDPRTLYAKIFEDEAEREAFLAEVCTMEWHTLHDAGRTLDEGVAELTARHPEHAGPIAAWRDRWWEMFSGPIQETCEAIEALHARGVAQYGLTNMSHETAPGTFALASAIGRFAGIVVSGHEGVLKPDAAIFRIAIDRFGLVPEETLFVDDSARNIDGARALGFLVHRFEEPAALRPALEALGLL
jgi:2-haloacid dehalogenase/putative hydrolase of the HAD superfamily